MRTQFLHLQATGLAAVLLLTVPSAAHTRQPKTPKLLSDPLELPELSHEPSIGEHAGLHPVDTSWYREIPDIQGLLKAYPQTSIGRLFSDPEITERFSALFEKAKSKIPADLDSEFDVNEAMQLPDKALQALGSLDSVSVSMSGWTAAADYSLTELGNARLVAQQLVVLQAELDNYLLEHGEALAQLSIANDPWGTPYEVLEDGRVHSTHFDPSLTQEQRAKALAPRLLDTIGVQIALDFVSPEAAQAAVSELRDRLQNLAPDQDLELTTASFAGADADLFRSSIDIEGLSLPAWVLVSGDRLFMGIAANTAESLAARAAGEAPSLTKHAAFAEMTAELASKHGVTAQGAGQDIVTMRSFQELGLLQMALEGLRMGVPEEALPFLETLSSRTPSVSLQRLEDGQYLDRSLVGPETPKSALSGILGAHPIQKQALQFLPDDSRILWASTVDWTKLGNFAWSTLMQLAEGKEDMVRQAMSDLEQGYGFHFENDFLASFDQDIAAYLQPLMAGIPNAGVVIKLKDVERMQKSLQGLSELIADASEGQLTWTSRKYKKMPVWSLKPNRKAAAGAELSEPMTAIMQAFQGPIQPSPSAVILDDHIVFALTAVNAKRMVKRYLDEERTSHAILSDASLPEEAEGMLFVNSPQMVLDLYGLGRAALGMMGGSLPIPISSADLPEPELIGRHFQPSLSWSKTTDDKRRSYKQVRSSFGPEGLAFYLAPTVAALWVMPRAPQPGDAESMPLLEQVEIEEASADVHPDVNRARARSVDVALMAYSLFNGGSYPQSLEELTILDEDGVAFLDDASHTTDRWSQPLMYKAFEPSPDEIGESEWSYQLWSIGPNGVDENGAGDDLMLRSRAGF